MYNMYPKLQYISLHEYHSKRISSTTYFNTLKTQSMIQVLSLFTTKHELLYFLLRVVRFVGLGDAFTAAFFAAAALGALAGVACLAAFPPRVFLGVAALGVAALTGVAALALAPLRVFFGDGLAGVLAAGLLRLAFTGSAATGLAATGAAAALPLRPAGLGVSGLAAGAFLARVVFLTGAGLGAAGDDTTLAALRDFFVTGSGVATATSSTTFLFGAFFGEASFTGVAFLGVAAAGLPRVLRPFALTGAGDGDFTTVAFAAPLPLLAATFGVAGF